MLVFLSPLGAAWHDPATAGLVDKLALDDLWAVIQPLLPSLLSLST
jgi:hypothetical protein